MTANDYTDAPGFSGGQGRAPKDIEQDGNGCIVLLIAAAVALAAGVLVWGAVRLLREAPPRHPPFSELPMDPKGGGR